MGVSFPSTSFGLVISSLIYFPWRNTRIGSSLNPITALRLTSFQADKRNPAGKEEIKWQSLSKLECHLVKVLALRNEKKTRDPTLLIQRRE